MDSEFFELLAFAAEVRAFAVIIAARALAKYLIPGCVGRWERGQVGI